MNYPNTPFTWKPDDKKQLASYSPIVKSYIPISNCSGDKWTTTTCHAHEIYPGCWFSHSVYYYDPFAEEMRNYWLEKYPPCATNGD